MQRYYLGNSFRRTSGTYRYIIEVPANSDPDYQWVEEKAYRFGRDHGIDMQMDVEEIRTEDGIHFAKSIIGVTLEHPEDFEAIVSHLLEAEIAYRADKNAYYQTDEGDALKQRAEERYAAWLDYENTRQDRERQFAAECLKWAQQRK